jgi:hypothetical protein
VRTVLKRGVLAKVKAAKLPAGAARTLKLRLTPRAAHAVKTTLHARRRAFVLVTASAASARGPQQATLRVALTR